jgi:uncharacterized protein
VCLQSIQSPNLKGDGEAVDWLVVMLRFGQEGLFDKLAAHKQLSTELLRRLIDRIIEFHHHAEHAPNHGGTVAMRAIIEGNRESMALVEDIIPLGFAERLRRRALSTLDEIGPQLDARRAAGRVKRCHGDLHLGNICMFKGQPRLFDSIEFSDDIACTDVLYDVAFLIMDLWQRNLKCEANFVFNRYLDMTDESDGLAVMPLFLSVRASIRAHVWAAASKTQLTSNAQMRFEALARHHVGCAMRMLGKRRPRLIAIGGLSGSGKSTVAYGLAPGIGVVPGARVIRSDVLRKRRRSIAPELRLPASAYGSLERGKVYHDLAQVAAKVVGSGYAAIVDAVFAEQQERENINTVTSATDVSFTGLWLTAPVDVLETRLRRRKNDASDATVEVLKTQLDDEIGTLGNWRTVDARGDAAATLDKARALAL